MILFAFLVALEVAAVVLAVRRFGWRAPLTIVLTYALVDELAVESLHRLLFTDPDHPLLVAIERFGWLARLAYHAESAVVVGWSAVLAGAAWTVFAVREPSVSHAGQGGPRRLTHPSRTARRLVLQAWVVVVAGLIGAFPLPPGMTAPVLHGVELAFVAAAMAALPAGWRSRTITRPEGQALGVVLVGEMVNALVGAWALGQGVYAVWDTVARWGYIVTWTVLCGVLMRAR